MKNPFGTNKRIRSKITGRGVSPGGWEISEIKRDGNGNYISAVNFLHELTMTFPEKLRHHRARLGITQSKLAEILGVSFGAVSKWERGLNLPAEIAQEGAVARLEKLPVDGDK
jgi:DNA-binding XRE family transcriptional regulator